MGKGAAAPGPWSTLLHMFWARICAGRGGSEGKASPPPREAHLRGTDRYPTISRAENAEVQESTQETKGRREKKRWHPAIYPRETGWLAGKGIGHHDPSIPPSPHPTACHQLGLGLGLVLTRLMLFCPLATRGRAVPCQNRSEGDADPEERLLSGTLASLGGLPTMCQAHPCLTSLKAVNNFRP